jgi:membrane protease YdiL (CAAX protease family)
MLATGGLFLVFENVLHLKLPFLAAAAIGWTVYLVRRLLRDRRLAAEWGLRVDNLPSAAPPILGFFGVGVAGLFAWHLGAGGGGLPRGAWILFLLYPIWAFLQQFVLQAIVASNLERLGLARAAVVPIAAALFGLAHAPDWPLAAICAAAGLAWTWIYLRRRHLPLLALTHAWLGALAYSWVLRRDPWGELFPQ